MRLLSDEEIGAIAEKMHDFFLDNFKDLESDDYLRIVLRLLVPEMAMRLANDDPYRLRPANDDRLLAEFAAIVKREVVADKPEMRH
jgi:hypothetical protein